MPRSCISPISVHLYATLLLIFGTILSPLSHAEKGNQELILSGGKGLDNTLIQQKSIASAEMLGVNWSYQFYDYPGKHRLQWWAQVSYSYMWEDHKGDEQTQQIWELKPVLRWYPRHEAQGLFGELGIGAAYLTERSFGAIDLSTNLNFSLHFGAGYTLLNGSTISLRYSHFSNGYTNTPNPGFDFASLNWHVHF
ncbi:acyloxyacyl hydrolase [Microbulbifer bruguierae]|uniref:Acyloxyacyl hydrolase n=1 Tax=Microbulbifer bruguierae TaxID=3029061 RepID=A0ABY8NDI1_9GAMM|nr:acyloxyacyl hydrolase [Microbulbifer bruguierae]WGL16765.1 acyloxyacyl hydrolase [Microbulbifer bruguierae]